MGNTLDRQPLIASEAERQDLALVEQVLDQRDGMTVLIAGAGEQFKLPAIGVQVLRGIIHHLAQGHAIAYFPLRAQLTTQDAAEILNVSRPHVVKLLRQGEIPFTMAGTHRRIDVEDLLAYKQRRDSERRQHLAELTRMSEDLGLYDEPIRPDDLED